MGKVRAILIFAIISALAPVAIGRPASAIGNVDAPTNVVARAADASALIKWKAPVNTGGELVTSYTVTSIPGAFTCTSTGSPAPTKCTITGLTNATPYTFSVVATTASGSSQASTASSAVTPLPGTTGVNFIGADATTVKWGEDYVYASAPRSNRIWPQYVYNWGSYSGVSVGTTYSAATVNGTNPVAPNNCSAAWQWVQILCDSDSGNTGTLRRDDPNVVYKPGFNAGFTIDSVTATSAFIVLDLGAVKNFTTLRIFQMFSDGKVTEAAIYRHPSTSTTWPTVSDAGWVEVARSKIGAGLKQNLTSTTTCPTSIDFSATSSRYIMMNFKNQGEFGDPSWIEVGAAKLFFETSEPVPGASCPPEPPTNASATAGNGTATVSWDASKGSVDTYQIQYSTNGGSSWSSATTNPASITGDLTTAQVTGLTNGSNYVFRVRAVNAVDSSPYTPPTTNSVSPLATLPNPPSSAATVTGISYGVTVSWQAVAGATSYTVTGNPGGTCSVNAPITTCTISGLTAGLPYTFSVAASNSFGTSGQSIASSAVLPTVTDPTPGTPGKPTATSSGTAATVTVTAPSSGGTPTSYTVTASPGGATCTVNGASGSCTISGLTPGTSYTFTSTATNSGGTSTSSVASDSISITSSSATENVSTNTSGATQATVVSATKKASVKKPASSASPEPTVTPGTAPSVTPTPEPSSSDEGSVNASEETIKTGLGSNYGLLAGIFAGLAVAIWFIAFRRRDEEEQS